MVETTNGVQQTAITDADLKAREVVPFQPAVFADFVSLIGRLFYDDGAIVLMDTLARAQRALSENELKEKLRWRENLLHQKLSALEKQLLLERVVDVDKSSSDYQSAGRGGGRHGSGNQRWRVHCHVFVAVEWRYKALISAIQSELRKAALRDDFECSNPACKVRVDLIDAASGPKSLEDEHPLCRVCGSLLTTAVRSFTVCSTLYCTSQRSEEARLKAEDRQRRANIQLAKLKDALQRVRGMVVPAFTASGSTTGNQQQGQGGGDGSRCSSLAGGGGAQSPSGASSDSSVTVGGNLQKKAGGK